MPSRPRAFSAPVVSTAFVDTETENLSQVYPKDIKSLGINLRGEARPANGSCLWTNDDPEVVVRNAQEEKRYLVISSDRHRMPTLLANRSRLVMQNLSFKTAWRFFLLGRSDESSISPEERTSSRVEAQSSRSSRTCSWWARVTARPSRPHLRFSPRPTSIDQQTFFATLRRLTKSDRSRRAVA